MSEQVITGGITISQFYSTLPPVTGDLTNGSTTIANVGDVTLIRAGQTISGTGIPPSTTVISVGVDSVLMSNPASTNSSGNALYFTLVDGDFWVSNAKFINVPGLYTTEDVIEGFLIYNNALDSGSLFPLAGIFDRFVITEVVDRPNSLLISFFCQFDEGVPYSSTGHFPQSAIQNAISSPTPNKRFSKLVSNDIGYDFQPGSVASQYNVDVQDVDDVYPSILGVTGIIVEGATGIKFIGAGIQSITQPVPGVALIQVGGGGSDVGVTGSTGYIPRFNNPHSIIDSVLPLFEDGSNRYLGVGTAFPKAGAHFYSTNSTGISGSVYIETNSNTKPSSIYLGARATGPAPIFDQVGVQIGIDPTTDPTNTGRGTLSLTVNNETTGVAGITGFGMHVKPRQSNSSANKNQGIYFGLREQVQISRFQEVAQTSDSSWSGVNSVSQNSKVTLWGQLTAPTSTELRTDRSGTASQYNYIFIRSNSIISYSARIQVFKSSTETADVEVRGMIKNSAGTTALVGSATIMTLNNSIGSFSPMSDITVSANNANSSLTISISSTVNLYIFGSLDMVDLGFPV